MKKSFLLCLIIICVTYNSKAQVSKEFVLDDQLTVQTELVYSNDFDEGIADWVTEKSDNTAGEVTIIDSKIDINVWGGTTVWCTHKMDGPVVIEYDAIVIDNGGEYDRVSDLNCYWMALDPNNPDDFFLNTTQRQGDASSLTLYYTGLGGYTNTKTRFRKFDGIDNPLLPEHDLSDPAYLITANAVNHIKLVAYDNMIRYYRNDQLIYDFYDESPYTEGYFGFRTTKNHMTVDNFRIYAINTCTNTTAHIEAECFDTMLGIKTENCSEGTLNVGYIQNGDWLKYDAIDLTGMNSIKARVSGKTTGNSIEVRLGSETGTLIGELEVSNTGGNQTWVTDSTNISQTTGIQDIYLVFTGGDGYLFNINHFGFSEDQELITGTSNTMDNTFSIYPNPTSDIVSLNTSASYQVINAFGRVILSGEGSQIDLSNQSNGVYSIQVKETVTRIIKL